MDSTLGTAKAARGVALGGVPETMLWTLYNRAVEAMRPDALFADADAVRIFESIAYPYAENFGAPNDPYAPSRSRIFDDAVRPWLAAHPGGTVVELGCGLETQFQRCDDGQVRWVCVDVPEAIDVRARFLPETERCRYVRRSALDLAWMDGVDASRGLFVTAQGLFMYFEEAEVRRLVTAIFERFPGVVFMFDAVPRWLSRKTMRGFRKTAHYTVPPMPWGRNREELVPLLRAWTTRIAEIETASYGQTRGLWGAVLRVGKRTPLARNIWPSVVLVRTQAA